jgi:hypothetical protein
MMTALLVDRVRTTLEHLGTDSSLDEVMELCPELTWNQVFLAIDDLSRAGKVRVTVDADRTYRVQTSPIIMMGEPPLTSPTERQAVKQEPVS